VTEIYFIVALVGPIVAVAALVLCVRIYRYVRWQIAVRDARRHAARVKYSYALMDRVMPGFTAKYDRISALESKQQPLRND
jgi:hypothetical protein